MNHLHAIVVRYVSPTDTKPGRVSLTSGRHWVGKSSKTIPWDHSAGGTIEMQAAKWLTERTEAAAWAAAWAEAAWAAARAAAEAAAARADFAPCAVLARLIAVGD